MNSASTIQVVYEYTIDQCSQVSHSFVWIEISNPWNTTRQKYSNNIWTSKFSGRRGLFHQSVFQIWFLWWNISYSWLRYFNFPWWDVSLHYSEKYTDLLHTVFVGLMPSSHVGGLFLADYPWLHILHTCNSQTVSFAANSKVLQQILQNPHLQELLVSVDSSPNPEHAMQLAMQEPLFVEFADECLGVIEPTEAAPT